MIRARFELGAEGFLLRADIASDAPTTVLLGESGAGKTSILDCLAGLRRPDSGLIELDGRLLFSSARGVDLPPRERRIGYVFQDYALFPHLTAEGNVALALPRGRKSEALARLERFGLGAVRARRPGQLSGGERQRLALARALAAEPRLLLLDEPFSALDRATREATYREFLALRAELGFRALLVTHSEAEARLLGQTFIRIREGEGREGLVERVAATPEEAA